MYYLKVKTEGLGSGSFNWSPSICGIPGEVAHQNIYLYRMYTGSQILVVNPKQGDALSAHLFLECMDCFHVF